MSFRVGVPVCDNRIAANVEAIARNASYSEWGIVTVSLW